MTTVKCENCGGTDIVIKDGFYVCQSCESRFEIIRDGKSDVTKQAWVNLLDSTINSLFAWGDAYEYTKYDTALQYAENNVIKQKFYPPSNFASKPSLFIPTESRKTYKTIGLSAAIGCGIIGFILFASKYLFLGFLLWLVGIAGIVLTRATSKSENYEISVKQYSEKVAEYNKNVKEAEEKYNADFKFAVDDYNRKIEEMRVTEETEFAKARSILNYIPEAYFDVDCLFRLRTIFANCRADTLKEAINVMHNDISLEKAEAAAERSRQDQLRLQAAQVEYARQAAVASEVALVMQKEQAMKLDKFIKENS